MSCNEDKWEDGDLFMHSITSPPEVAQLGRGAIVEQCNRENLGSEELLRTADCIWPDVEQSPHTSGEELGRYAEVTVNRPSLLLNPETNRDISRHLFLCDQCLEDYLLITGLLRTPTDMSAQEFEVDLTFLNNPAA